MPVILPTSVSLVNVDQTTDDPKLARADFVDVMTKFNTLLGQINSIGIMQPGDGTELLAQASGTKDSLRVKLDGTTLGRSANGLKLASVTTDLLEGGVALPGVDKYYGTNAASVKGFYSFSSSADKVPLAGGTMTGTLLMSGVAKIRASGVSAVTTGFEIAGSVDLGALFARSAVRSLVNAYSPYGVSDVNISFSGGVITLNVAYATEPGGGGPPA